MCLTHPIKTFSGGIHMGMKERKGAHDNKLSRYELTINNLEVFQHRAIYVLMRKYASSTLAHPSGLSNSKLILSLKFFAS